MRIVRRRRLAVLATLASIGGLVAVLAAPAAFAGYAVQPADGSIVTSTSPSFLVYVETSDTLPQVEVSTSPDHSSYGFSGGYVGSCTPTTPFGETYKFTCQLPMFETPLAPGTYYWAYTFDHNVCTTAYGFTSCYPQAQFSGPFKFTVAQPVAPPAAGLISPSDGAVVGAMPTLTIHGPTGASMEIYAADSSARLSDGSPAIAAAFSCLGAASVDSTYTCVPDNAYELQAGQTYYWWAVIVVDGNRWIYDTRRFTVRIAPTGGATSGGNNGTHVISDAAELPQSAHFVGTSVKQSRLSAASYWVTKVAGVPKTLAVACWNGADWPGVSGDTGDAYYSLLGFYNPTMPHWVHLSPTICRGIETLLYHRPIYPNRIVADAVDAVTHEMIHAIGISDEALTECYAMQVTLLMALRLGVPLKYSQRLARLTLTNYLFHPPQYVDTLRCREGGAWDLQPTRPSQPWHDQALG